jgi:8-oxo-dGTP diphosphatase
VAASASIQPSRRHGSQTDVTVTAIHVVAAVLEDADGRVLLARRAKGAHQGGLWEFPGGKVEPAESAGEALRRELREEIAIEVRAHRPLIRVRHAYADRTVVLDVHRVTSWSGEAIGLEGQPLAWVALGDLDRYPMPAADRPIVTAIRLPDTYVITPPEPADADAFAASLKAVLRHGHRLVQLRLPGVDRAAVEPHARRAVDLCNEAGARLLVHRDPDLAESVGAHGVHLSAAQLRGLTGRPLPSGRLVGASCHDGEELALAEALGADFAVLSPVLPTASHPGAPHLGWDRFAALVEAARIPVYALGGMTADFIDTAWRHGAQGVAGIRGFWP